MECCCVEVALRVDVSEMAGARPSNLARAACLGEPAQRYGALPADFPPGLFERGARPIRKCRVRTLVVYSNRRSAPSAKSLHEVARKKRTIDRRRDKALRVQLVLGHPTTDGKNARGWTLSVIRVISHEGKAGSVVMAARYDDDIRLENKLGGNKVDQTAPAKNGDSLVSAHAPRLSSRQHRCNPSHHQSLRLL
jgi:hypothetical protein